MIPAGLEAGDIVLTGRKSQGVISLAIKFGQRLRGYAPEHRQFSHAALVIDPDGMIAEAQEKGVVYANISKYHPDDYVVIHTNVCVLDVAEVLAFAESVVKARTGYGFATFIGLAIYCLTGAQLCLQQTGTMICSGFVAAALTRAGAIFDRPPFANMPADLAKHFGYKDAA